MSAPPGSTLPPADPPPPRGLAGGGGASGEKPGDHIGPYKLLSIIGEGGMGIVWLAERREPMVQRVALKIIHPGMNSRDVIARFEQERQALAVMDHPHVAKVFDGGVTPPEMGARPYFVMEHVQGEPITTFCDRHTYTLRQRLELFIPVCEAVQHAHHKGIIHRDLKPSNILVTLRDGRAVPKVIDFGVAKAVSHTLTEKSIFTEQGRLIGTPEYMSPEQAEMGALDIDTRTDVYSLGVVLYELLAGVLPFDGQSLRAAGYDAIRKVIREQEAPRPSTRLSTVDDATGRQIARARHDERASLARELQRELDWIPLKALRKDRSDRYASAADLAVDVRAYLAGEPLAAGPRSLRYRIGKSLHRQRGKIRTGVLVIAVTALSLWCAHLLNRDTVNVIAHESDASNDAAARHLAGTFKLALERMGASTVQVIGVQAPTVSADDSSLARALVTKLSERLREIDVQTTDPAWTVGRVTDSVWEKTGDKVRADGVGLLVALTFSSGQEDARLLTSMEILDVRSGRTTSRFAFEVRSDHPSGSVSAAGIKVYADALAVRIQSQIVNWYLGNAAPP